MAFNADIDYKALQNELKKRMASTATTAGVGSKSDLQAQYDALEQSRLEKMASNLSKYGKYATDSEIDSAAGIVAQNQIGTAFDTQAKNLNQSFDTAKQNADNDALSRGMARSSFVSDRLATLDSNRANALSDVDASKALALQSARQSVLDNYQTNAANALSQEKKDFGNNIMAYYQDYQAQINKVQGDNDTTNDWQIPMLQAARNEKILAQQKAAATASKSTGSSGGSSGGTNSSVNSSTATPTTATVSSPYSVIQDINTLRQQGKTNAQIKQYAQQAYNSGAITGAEYQMYVQYSGS